MLYSTELPSHESCISAAKLRIFIDIFDFVAVFCLKFGILWLLLQLYRENRKNDTHENNDKDPLDDVSADVCVDRIGSVVSSP